MSLFAAGLQFGIVFITSPEPHDAWLGFAATTFAAIALVDVTMSWASDRELGPSFLVILVLSLFIAVTYLAAEQARVGYDESLVRGPDNSKAWLAVLAAACMFSDVFVRARESYARLG
jgi:hypothetical protein